MLSDEDSQQRVETLLLSRAFYEEQLSGNTSGLPPWSELAQRAAAGGTAGLSVARSSLDRGVLASNTSNGEDDDAPPADYTTDAACHLKVGVWLAIIITNSAVWVAIGVLTAGLGALVGFVGILLYQHVLVRLLKKHTYLEDAEEESNGVGRRARLADGQGDDHAHSAYVSLCVTRLWVLVPLSISCQGALVVSAVIAPLLYPDKDNDYHNPNGPVEGNSQYHSDTAMQSILLDDPEFQAETRDLIMAISVLMLVFVPHLAAAWLIWERVRPMPILLNLFGSGTAVVGQSFFVLRTAVQLFIKGEQKETPWDIVLNCFLLPHPMYIPMLAAAAVLTRLAWDARQRRFSLKRRRMPLRVLWLVNIAGVTLFFASLAVFAPWCWESEMQQRTSLEEGLPSDEKVSTERLTNETVGERHDVTTTPPDVAIMMKQGRPREKNYRPRGYRQQSRNNSDLSHWLAYVLVQLTLVFHALVFRQWRLLVLSAVAYLAAFIRFWILIEFLIRSLSDGVSGNDDDGDDDCSLTATLLATVVVGFTQVAFVLAALRLAKRSPRTGHQWCCWLLGIDERSGSDSGSNASAVRSLGEPMLDRTPGNREDATGAG